MGQGNLIFLAEGSFAPLPSGRHTTSLGLPNFYARLTPCKCFANLRISKFGLTRLTWADEIVGVII